MLLNSYFRKLLDRSGTKDPFRQSPALGLLGFKAFLGVFAKCLGTGLGVDLQHAGARICVRVPIHQTSNTMNVELELKVPLWKPLESGSLPSDGRVICD